MKPYPLRQRSTHLCAIIYRLHGSTSFTALYMAQHIFWNFFFLPGSRLRPETQLKSVAHCSVEAISFFFGIIDLSLSLFFLLLFALYFWKELWPTYVLFTIDLVHEEVSAGFLVQNWILRAFFGCSLLWKIPSIFTHEWRKKSTVFCLFWYVLPMLFSFMRCWLYC